LDLTPFWDTSITSKSGRLSIILDQRRRREDEKTRRIFSKPFRRVKRKTRNRENESNSNDQPADRRPIEHCPRNIVVGGAYGVPFAHPHTHALAIFEISRNSYLSMTTTTTIIIFNNYFNNNVITTRSTGTIIIIIIVVVIIIILVTGCVWKSTDEDEWRMNATRVRANCKTPPSAEDAR